MMSPVVLIDSDKGTVRAKGKIMTNMLKIGLLSTLLIICSQLTATELDEFSVLILGPLDGRAVVKLPGGKMQVVGNGETLPGTQATVKQILSDRPSGIGETPVTDAVWEYPVSAQNALQRWDHARHF
jgi:hypothetical protein